MPLPPQHIMSEPIPVPPISRAYPAPWRPHPHGPNVEELMLELRHEEEIFQRIINNARHEENSIEDLLRQGLHLAFPKAGKEDLERAYELFQAREQRWQNALDEEGNPTWISLTLQDKPKENNLSEAEGELPVDEDAGAQAEEPEEKKTKRWGRSYFSHHLQTMPPGGFSTQEQGRKNSRRKRQGRQPLPPEPRPFRRAIRIVFAAAFFALVYYSVIVRGCAAKL